MFTKHGIYYRFSFQKMLWYDAISIHDIFSYHNILQPEIRRLIKLGVRGLGLQSLRPWPGW